MPNCIAVDRSGRINNLIGWWWMCLVQAVAHGGVTLTSNINSTQRMLTAWFKCRGTLLTRQYITSNLLALLSISLVVSFLRRISIKYYILLINIKCISLLNSVSKHFLTTWTVYLQPI